MGRTILAVVLGYVTMFVLVMVSTFALAAILLGDSFDPAGMAEGAMSDLSTSYLVANMVCSFAAAVAGGFVTAWVAASDPLRHGHYLSIVVLVLGAISVLFPSGQPIWYVIVLPVIGFFGVRLGARLRARS
jgi:ABC-type branched-subunit amino acid transport system permease subunit